MSWQRRRAGPPCLASIVISSGRRSKQNPKKNIPCVLPNNVAGQRQTPATANSNRRRDSRLGARQASSPLSPLLLPMNRREAQPSRPPLRTPHHPHIHPRAGTCSWDIRDDRSHHQREQVRSLERARLTKRGAGERAGLAIVPASCSHHARRGLDQARFSLETWAVSP